MEPGLGDVGGGSVGRENSKSLLNWVVGCIFGELYILWSTDF